MSPLSLNPEDAEEVPLDQRERVTVMDAYTEMTDYGGRVQTACPVLTLEVRTKTGTKRLRSYSAGGPEHVKANAEGNGFEPVGDSRGMPAQCNAIAFLQSLVAAGFPSAELAGGDVTAIIGLELNMMEVDQPQRFAPRPKPIIGLDGQPKKDAPGQPLFHPPEKPKRFWLVESIVGAESHLPGLAAPPHPQPVAQPLPRASTPVHQRPPALAAPPKPALDTPGPYKDAAPAPAAPAPVKPLELTEDEIPF